MPKKIIIVSSAPQIRYPDCYGIDMAKLGDFIAFQAAIAQIEAEENEIDDSEIPSENSDDPIVDDEGITIESDKGSEDEPNSTDETEISEN